MEQVLYRCLFTGILISVGVSEVCLPRVLGMRFQQTVCHFQGSLSSNDVEQAPLTPPPLATPSATRPRNLTAEESERARALWKTLLEKWAEAWPYTRERVRRSQMTEGDDMKSYDDLVATLRKLSMRDTFKKGTIHTALIKNLRFTRDGGTLLSSRYVSIYERNATISSNGRSLVGTIRASQLPCK